MTTDRTTDVTDHSLGRVRYTHKHDLSQHTYTHIGERENERARARATCRASRRVTSVPCTEYVIRKLSTPREKKYRAREGEREREREKGKRKRERERERKKKNWHGIDRDRWETRKKNNGAIKIGVKRNEGKKNEVKGDKIFHRK